MISAKQFFICAIIFIIQTCMVHSSCSVIQSESGSIYDMFVVNGSINYHKCWEILNPNKQKLHIRIEELYSGVPRGGIVKNFDPIDVGNLTIILNDENKRFTYESSYTGSLYTKSSIVEIHFIVNSMLIADNYITNFTLNFETIAGKSTCSQIDGEKGTISYSYEAYGLNRTSKCWEIFNPNNDQMQIHLKELNLGIAPSSNCNLTVVMKDDERTYTFWSRLNSGSLVTNSSKVEITFNINSAALLNWYKTNFTLQFQKMFEINMKDDLSRAIALLRNQSPHLLNQRDNSLKALIALYLAGNATFDGTDIKEELLVRRAEMRITSSLRRKSISDMELSTYINFLLITCNSPRHFASYDLIQQVLNHLEVSSNFTHPAVYLALCNANETWPLRAVRDLQNVLNSRTGYAFLKGLVYAGCTQIKEERGTISYSYTAYGQNGISTCWEVLNPSKHQLHLHLEELHLYGATSSRNNLTVILKDESKTFVYWSGLNTGNLITTSSKVEIQYNVFSGNLPNYYKTNFTFKFQKEPKEDVNVEEVRANMVNLLRNQQLPLLDSGENTIKALTALYLAGNTSFDGTDVREELLLRRAEMKIISSLQRSAATETDLSTFINFLQVSCNSPRRFASYDLVQLLLSHLQNYSNITHPSVYLALCNAKEQWPDRASSDLIKILESKAKYIFLKDIQAFAIMAVSCKLNQNDKAFSNSVDGKNLVSKQNASINRLMQTQFIDGSFGDIYETAVAVQALISTKKDLLPNWNYQSAIKYILKELNNTAVDFQAIYLSLPLLNKKSLIDITERNCSGNPGNYEDLLSETIGSKIEVPSDRVRYSLYIGDKKELIRTTTFRILENFTAYQIMLLAEAENVKFKFHWRRLSGKMYVHKISDIPNDPESGKFWQLYIISDTSKSSKLYDFTGPDEINVRNGDHIIFWYKTASL